MNVTQIVKRLALTGLAVALGTCAGWIPTAHAQSPGAGACDPASRQATVTSREQLLAAAADECVREIVVRGRLRDVPTLRLAAGKRLNGADDQATIAFAAGVDGVQLTSDNAVRRLNLTAGPRQRAIFNDTSVPGLGRIELAGVTTIGQVQMLVADLVLAGDVVVDGLDIIAADTRGRTGPQALFYGGLLEARQGAFTLWNRQKAGAVTVGADLRGISVGRAGAPVLGSGVLVFGGWELVFPSAHGDFLGGEAVGELLREINADGAVGRVKVTRLETGALYSDSAVRDDQADKVGGAAIFMGPAAPIKTLVARGPVTTYGLNSGGADFFAPADELIFKDKITTYGATGIAVVIWPAVRTLRVEAPIETFGAGGRGLNVYAGNVGSAEFERIETHGPGAVGVELRRSVGKLMVHRGIQTYGGIGLNLVLGRLVPLAAMAVDVYQGAAIEELDAGGPIATAGDGVHAVVVGSDSRIGTLRARCGVMATGKDARQFDIQGGTIASTITPPAARLRIVSVRRARGSRQLAVVLAATGQPVRDVAVTVRAHRDGRLLARRALGGIDNGKRRVIVALPRRSPARLDVAASGRSCERAVRAPRRLG